MSDTSNNEQYELYQQKKNTTFRLATLSIIVLGASGDLAKKKTYPALFDLFAHGYLPNRCIVTRLFML